MSLRRENFPNDVDGEVLFRLFEAGVDLSQPLELEFYCYVEGLTQANLVAKKTKALGFFPDIYEDDITAKVSVYNIKTMLPTYENIMETQSVLNVLLESFGVSCDGWGTLSIDQ